MYFFPSLAHLKVSELFDVRFSVSRRLDKKDAKKEHEKLISFVAGISPKRPARRLRSHNNVIGLIMSVTSFSPRARLIGRGENDS